MSGMSAAIVVFMFLLFFGMPVAFAIGISGLTFFLATPGGLPLTVVAQKAISTTQSFTMLAIPLFIFAGNLMNNTGITKRLVRLADVLTGHMYGNIAQVSCILSALMGGCSGSAAADAAMECRLLGPSMTARGYSKGWSAAINGWSSLIVCTIPPSMGLILYGSVGEVSIGRLFTAGIVPGIMMMVVLMIAVRISAKRRNYLPARNTHASLKEILLALKDGIWALLFPIFLIVFMRYGIMTASESGAFSAIYALCVGKFIYRELTWESFLISVKDSTKDISSVALILALSGIFGYGIVYDSIPQAMAQGLMAVTTNRYLMLSIICLLLLFMGMFVQTTVICLMMTPILIPVIKSIGVDPVHFGLVMMTCCTSGIMTPPVGSALYATSSIMGCAPEETFKEGMPFFIAILVTVAIMIVFPGSVLWLPNLLFK